MMTVVVNLELAMPVATCDATRTRRECHVKDKWSRGKPGAEMGLLSLPSFVLRLKFILDVVYG